MFNRGVDQLLRALPDLADLSGDNVRRLITRAWLEAVDRRDLGGPGIDAAAEAGDLRRLATALEVHAILGLDLQEETIRACALVAAEALEVASDIASLVEEPEPLPWILGSRQRFERVEASLLYLIAGYDANAAVAARRIGRREEGDDAEADVSEWCLGMVRALVQLRRPSSEGPPEPPGPDAWLPEQIRHEIWSQMGSLVGAHVRWLRFEEEDDQGAPAALRQLASQLERGRDGAAVAASHADLHHLLLLLTAACEGTTQRALRGVSSPEGDGGRFANYQRRRADTRPLLWPAAVEYAAKALPGPDAHAVISVPTGAGKFGVAEMAVAQAVRTGWVLYHAPTNALVGQVRRQLVEVVGRLAGVSVREFLGGAEYTELAGEALGDIEERQVLVMTPEKCSLALRQSPEAFERLALCVVDEAHNLGQRDSRAVIAELVCSEVLHRAPEVRVLMLSALLRDPGELAEWLAGATGVEALVIDQPWRPTRTLRAVAGFDRDEADTAAEMAEAQLEELPPSRKKIEFQAPIALFAGLQGAWRTEDSDDYALVRTSITAPLILHREKGASLEGYRNPAVRSIVQALGEQGHRVLAFLPRSKHDSFTLARDIPGFEDRTPEEGDADIDALLNLVDAELGVPSALRDALAKGVAVHTGAMLREEQRASELAFEREVAVAMFATGTLAQGLNLPATAVVIGGTDIGYDAHATAADKAERARAQLLNAIGRAGRAYVAARSMAIVVPNRALGFSAATSAAETVSQATFLREEDASTEIASQLDNLIERALDGTLDMRTMSASEQTAFAFLSFAAGDDNAEGVLGRSWGAHRAAAAARADQIADGLQRLGDRFLADAKAPSWVALAAHRAGLALPETAELHTALRERLEHWTAPTSVGDWADRMIAVLRNLPAAVLARTLPSAPYKSTLVAGAWGEDRHAQDAAWEAFARTLDVWLNGEPLIVVASEAHGEDLERNPGRGSRDPIPRVLRLVTDGFGFGLAIVAGALGATVAAGQEADPQGPWDLPGESARALALLPLAIRLGAGTPGAIAWMRAGARPRAVAHMLDGRIAVPHELDDDELRVWAWRSLQQIGDLTLDPAESDDERALLASLILARGAA